MSFDNNRKDFERSLEKMGEAIDILESSVRDDILEDLRAVISEYDGHYSGDIDDMIAEKDDLQYKVDEAEL